MIERNNLILDLIAAEDYDIYSIILNTLILCGTLNDVLDVGVDDVPVCFGGALLGARVVIVVEVIEWVKIGISAVQLHT